MQTPSNPPTAALERLTAKLILDLAPGTAAIALAKHAPDCPACDGKSNCRCVPQLSTHGIDDEGGWMHTFAAIACRTPMPHRTLTDEEAKVIHTTQCAGGKIITVIRYPERHRLDRACELFVTGEGLDPTYCEQIEAIAQAYQEQANELGERLAISWPVSGGHRLVMNFAPRNTATTPHL